jgi:hypothetical protein
MVRVLVTTSPVSKLNQTKGDRHRNAGEVANDVQDVQDDSQSTVAIFAVVGRAAGHDGNGGILVQDNETGNGGGCEVLGDRQCVVVSW